MALSKLSDRPALVSVPESTTLKEDAFDDVIVGWASVLEAYEFRGAARILLNFLDVKTQIHH
jgi:hypothetical protein